jgi:hypothetical protein
MTGAPEVHPPKLASVDDLAQALIAAARTIEAMAVRAAFQIDLAMDYAQSLRALGEANLASDSSAEVYLD